MIILDNPVLELIGVKKSIRGKEIIKGLDFSLFPSEVFGFLGPNGAGKTTTIRMIVGLIKPTQGEIRICGSSVSKEFIKAMSNVGCIIESPEMYKFLTGMDNLKQYGAMDKRVNKKRLDEVVELVGLQNRINDKVSTYSLGMRQRLGIAQALLSKPKLLILDEPSNGLDPAGISEFRKIIKQLAHEEGMAVFVSSHLLSEVQLLCDKVSIIKQGRIIKTALVKDLLIDEKVQWQLHDPVKALEILEKSWKIKGQLLGDQLISAEVGNTSLEAINTDFIQNGIRLKYSYSTQNTLEELFLNLTEGDEIV